MVVWLRSEVSLHKGIKSRITAILVILLKHIFLKITVLITLKVVNRPNNLQQEICPCRYFFKFVFAIICHKKVFRSKKVGVYFYTMSDRTFKVIAAFAGKSLHNMLLFKTLIKLR